MSMKLTSGCQTESLDNISEAASGHLHQPVGIFISQWAFVISSEHQQIRQWAIVSQSSSEQLSSSQKQH
jgi:hypothetical protein